MRKQFNIIAFSHGIWYNKISDNTKFGEENMEQPRILISDYIDGSVLNVSKKYDKCISTGNSQKLFDTIKESESLIESIKNPLSEMQLYYDIGTGYGDLRRLSKTEDYIEKEIFNLRKAVNVFESADSKHLFSQNESSIANYLLVLIYVNLGNALKSVKRYIAAIDTYFYALNIDSAFSMAYANLSIALFEYAAIQEDNIYRDYLNHGAYYYYKKTIQYKENLHVPEILKNIESYINLFSEEYTHNFLEKDIEPPFYDFISKDEKDYRSYCNLFRLFLNPISDILPNQCFWIDDIQMPFVKNKLVPKELTEYYELFSQIKSEYAYGRYLWYKAENDKVEENPFWEKDIDLATCKKYHSDYSYRDFMARTAYKTIYAIFDRIGYFINYYWEIGLKGNNISFKKIFSDEQSGINKLKAQSIKELTPLYWIQKDLSENETVCITNPNSIKLAKMRNDMEHNALRTITNKIDVELKITQVTYRENIERNTLELLKLLRESIISLVLAVHAKQKKVKNIN